MTLGKISFEGVRLRLSNSKKQYRCPRDNKQSGYNTDVPQLKTGWEILLVKISLSAHNFPTFLSFLLHTAFCLLSLTPVSPYSCKPLNTSRLAFLSCPDTVFPPVSLSRAAALGGKHLVLTI